MIKVVPKANKVVGVCQWRINCIFSIAVKIHKEKIFFVKTPNHNTTAVSDSHTLLLVSSPKCIFHHNFRLFSDSHQGSLSGALFISLHQLKKVYVQWDLQRAFLMDSMHLTTPSELKSQFNYSLQRQKSYISQTFLF